MESVKQPGVTDTRTWGAREGQCETSVTDATDPSEDEWQYEAGEALERVWGFRVRPGERVIQPGIFYCVACGVSQPFRAGETARNCLRHEAQSKWLWRSGDEK